MIKLSVSGGFNNIEKFFKNVKTSNYGSILDKYGSEGVRLLSSATPIDSGDTATSWGYTIQRSKKGISIVWTNSSVGNSDTPIAILIQYGHATGNGGYVQGRDFINPAIKPLFDRLANDVWKEVIKI